MARGSSDPGGGGGSYGAGAGGEAGGGGEGAVIDVPLLARSGSIKNNGQYTLTKTYVTTEESSLSTINDFIPGFLPTAINWRALGGGAYEKTVDYESFKLSTGNNSPVEEKEGIQGRFELEIQDELHPIAGHPNIREIIKKYQGTIDENNRVSFPVTYKTPEGSRRTNPMAGKLFYTKPTAVFRHIQQREDIPTDIWQNVGKKIEKLPAGFPNPPPEVNDSGEAITWYWVILSPAIYRRGNSWEIIKTYKLTEANSPNELYKMAVVQ